MGDKWGTVSASVKPYHKFRARSLESTERPDKDFDSYRLVAVLLRIGVGSADLLPLLAPLDISSIDPVLRLPSILKSPP
jgi:hypothetical protein